MAISSLRFPISPVSPVIGVWTNLRSRASKTVKYTLTDWDPLTTSRAKNTTNGDYRGCGTALHPVPRACLHRRLPWWVGTLQTAVLSSRGGDIACAQRGT